jgi:hypothetical protein
MAVLSARMFEARHIWWGAGNSQPASIGQRYQCVRSGQRFRDGALLQAGALRSALSFPARLKANVRVSRRFVLSRLICSSH